MNAAPGSGLRALLVRLAHALRRVADWLQPVQPDMAQSQLEGPPADWLERVRKGAPQLLVPPAQGGTPQQFARVPRAPVMPPIPAPAVPQQLKPHTAAPGVPVVQLGNRRSGISAPEAPHVRHPEPGTPVAPSETQRSRVRAPQLRLGRPLPSPTPFPPPSKAPAQQPRAARSERPALPASPTTPQLRPAPSVVTSAAPGRARARTWPELPAPVTVRARPPQQARAPETSPESSRPAPARNPDMPPRAKSVHTLTAQPPEKPLALRPTEPVEIVNELDSSKPSHQPTAAIPNLRHRGTSAISPPPPNSWPELPDEALPAQTDWAEAMARSARVGQLLAEQRGDASWSA